MRVEIPMINWHNQLPLLAVDYKNGRLATASNDATIRVRLDIPLPCVLSEFHPVFSRCYSKEVHVTSMFSPQLDFILFFIDAHV